MTAAERLYPTDTTPAVYARHCLRYQRAIQCADGARGVWLDAACGTGYGTEMMLPYADKVIGIDHNVLAIRFAKQTYCGRGRALTFECYDVCSSLRGFADGGLDVIISVETLEHLPANRQSIFIRRIAEALNAGGVAVITCPLGNGLNPKNPYHLHEPTEVELRVLVSAHFAEYQLTIRHVPMTTGEVQPNAYVTCRHAS